VAEVHTCEGMHLQTLKNKNFHIYPYVFCTLNLLVFFFLHQLPKTQTTPTSLIYTFQLLSLNYPLNLENPSSSTSTTLIHSGGSTTPNPFHLHSHALLSTTIYNLQSRLSFLHLKNLLMQTTIVSTLFRRPPSSCNHKGTFKSFQRH